MPGYWDLVGRGPSLMQIAQAAGITRAQREQREAQRQEFDLRKSQFEQRKAEVEADRQAREQAATGQRQANVKRFVAQGLQSGQLDMDRANKLLSAQGIDASEILTPQFAGTYSVPEQPALDPGGVEGMGPAAPAQQGLAPEDALVAQQGAGQQFAEPEFTQPDQQAAAQELMAQSAGVLGAPPAPKPGAGRTTNDIVNFTAISGMDPSDPRFGPEFRKWMQGREKARATQNIINLPKQTEKEQTDKLFEAEDTLVMIDELKDLAMVPGTEDSPQYNWGQFLSAGSQLKNWTLNKLDKLDPDLLNEEQRAAVGKANQFRAVLDKYRSEEYKRLLGSAQSEAEIKNLVNAVISADMSSSQFEAAMGNLQRVTERNARVAQAALEAGRPRTRAYRARYKELEKLAKRREYLEDQRAAGNVPDEVYQQALSELEQDGAP